MLYSYCLFEDRFTEELRLAKLVGGCPCVITCLPYLFDYSLVLLVSVVHVLHLDLRDRLNGAGTVLEGSW